MTVSLCIVIHFAPSHWRVFQWPYCCTPFWYAAAYSILCWATRQEISSCSHNLSKVFFPPLLWFTIKATTQFYWCVKYSVLIAYVPDTICLLKYVFLFCFPFRQSLDQAREQHFCKALARWSWSRFACKFPNPNSESSVSMQIRLDALSDSAELPNTHTVGDIGLKSVLSRVTMYDAQASVWKMCRKCLKHLAVEKRWLHMC